MCVISLLRAVRMMDVCVCVSARACGVRFGGVTPSDVAWSGYEVSGKVARHDASKQHPNSDFEQTGVLYRKVMTAAERDRLIANIVGHLKNARRDLQGSCVVVLWLCPARRCVTLCLCL